MLAVVGKSLRALGLAAAVVTFSGCVEFGMDIPQWWSTKKSRQKAADLASYGPTGRQKIEHLVVLREKAASYSPQEKAIISDDLVRELQAETNADVRRNIVRTLAVYPSERSAAAMSAALKDSDLDVRVAACRGLEKIGGGGSTAALGELLASDTNIDVRLAAAKALGTRREPAAVAALGNALEDGDPAMQLRAMASMKTSSGKDLGNDVNAWRQFARTIAPQGNQEAPQSNQEIASGRQGQKR